MPRPVARLVPVFLVSSILQLAVPAAMAQSGDANLNPFASDVRKAIAPLPGEAARPELNPKSSESSACRALRMRMDRARSAAPEQPRAFYPDSPRRDGQPSPQRPAATVAPDPVAALEQRYRNECN